MQQDKAAANPPKTNQQVEWLQRTLQQNPLRVQICVDNSAL